MLHIFISFKYPPSDVILAKVNPFLRSLFIFAIIICTAAITNGQDSTITISADSMHYDKNGGRPCRQAKDPPPVTALEHFRSKE